MSQKPDSHETFGTVQIGEVVCPASQPLPDTINVLLTFEEAMRLQIALAQALAKLNRYGRSTKEARESAVGLCLRLHFKRIRITEGNLPAKPRSSDEARSGVGKGLKRLNQVENEMQSLLVKVSGDEFAKFLRKHGQYWRADGYDQSFAEYERGAASVEELVDDLAAYGISSGDWDEHFYVFNVNTEEALDPYEIANRVRVDSAREVKAEELDAFVVRRGGNDFLYMACSPIEACDGRYITILPAENPWREETTERGENAL